MDRGMPGKVSRMLLPLLLHVVVYLSLWKVATSDSFLDYTIQEKRPNDTKVANLALDAGLYSSLFLSDQEQTTYALLVPTSHFRVDRLGFLWTNDVINRDNLCPQQWTCLLTPDVVVTVNGVLYMIIKIRITVTDLNDYAPTFIPDHVDHTFPEGTSIGELVPLPTAVDLDSPPNGIMGYRLDPASNQFDLKVQNISGNFDVRLLLTKPFDREQQSSYSLKMIAFDGGNPPLSGTLTINILVSDVNDNPPVFDNTTYRVQIPESTSVGRVLITLHASDSDSGRNGQVQYKFSPRSQNIYGGVFSLDALSGDVTLLQSLNYVQQNMYNLSVFAVDQGSNPMTGVAALLIQVVSSMDSPPVIVMDTLGQFSDRTDIPEDSPIGTFVVHASVSDRDEGPSGSVNCSITGSDSSNFQIVQLLPMEYKILTTKMFTGKSGTSLLLVLSCQDGGSPSRTSTAQLGVLITRSETTPPTTHSPITQAPFPRPPSTQLPIGPPIFSSQIYNVSLSTRTFQNSFVLQVRILNSSVVKNTDVVFSLSPEVTDRFNIDPVSGIIRTVKEFKQVPTGSIKFNVIARSVSGNASSTSEVRVLVWEPVEFDSRVYVFNISSGSAAGTEIGRVTSASRGNAIYRISAMHSNDSIQHFSIDPTTGVIYVASAFGEDSSDKYELVVSATSSLIPGVNDSTEVVVNLFHEGVPIITFPNSSNNTVCIPSSFPVDGLVAVVTAASGSDGVIFSLGNGNETGDFFVVSSTGEVRLKAGLNGMENVTFELDLIASTSSSAKISSSATLFVLITESQRLTGSPPLLSGDIHSVILGVVLGVGLAIVAAILIAILVVCRKNRKQDQDVRSVFWTSVEIQPPTQQQPQPQPQQQASCQPPSVELKPISVDYMNMLHPPVQRFSREITVDILHTPDRYTPGTQADSPVSTEIDADSGCPSNSGSQTSSEDGAVPQYRKEKTRISMNRGQHPVAGVVCSQPGVLPPHSTDVASSPPSGYSTNPVGAVLPPPSPFASAVPEWLRSRVNAAAAEASAGLDARPAIPVIVPTVGTDARPSISIGGPPVRLDARFSTPVSAPAVGLDSRASNRVSAPPLGLDARASNRVSAPAVGLDSRASNRVSAPPAGLDARPTLPPLKPSLSRSASVASRKSMLSITSGNDAGQEQKKRVHFAEQNQYLENSCQSSIESVSDDVTDDVNNDDVDDEAEGDGASEMSYTNSDSGSSKSFQSHGSYYLGQPPYPPPGVAFGSFLPEDGSLV